MTKSERAVIIKTIKLCEITIEKTVLKSRSLTKRNILLV